jgi:hypothetical protein
VEEMMSDLPSEYGRLLAERDRLIAEGADPDELAMPDKPSVEATVGEWEDQRDYSTGQTRDALRRALALPRVISAVSGHAPGHAASYVIEALGEDGFTVARLSAEPPLDVERLAEALHDSMCATSHHDKSVECRTHATYRNITLSVAPRYVRLSKEAGS